MRRPLIFKTCALVFALGTTALVAQQPPAQQPPSQPAGQQRPAAPATAKPPTLAFTTEAGLLLIQIKGDQTAAFEELVAKLKAGAAKATDPAVKQQLAGLRVFKASEPAQ